MTLLLLITLTKAKSQDTIKVVNFRVVNAQTDSPVELAHVINQTQREATIADLLGYFKIPVVIGDTISVTSLGFYNQILYSWGQYNNDSSYYTIRLKPRTYEILELKVSWFSNYEGFLKAVTYLKLPLTPDEQRIARITLYFQKSISMLNLMALPRSTSGAGFGKDWMTKQNEKLKEKLEKERKQRAIERKYSPGIVTALTGLKGNEVFWFMEYCAFKDDYILKVSDYEIRLRIIDKFKIYNQDKPNQNLK